MPVCDSKTPSTCFFNSTPPSQLVALVAVLASAANTAGDATAIGATTAAVNAASAASTAGTDNGNLATVTAAARTAVAWAAAAGATATAAPMAATAAAAAPTTERQRRHWRRRRHWRQRQSPPQSTPATTPHARPPTPPPSPTPPSPIPELSDQHAIDCGAGQARRRAGHERTATMYTHMEAGLCRSPFMCIRRKRKELEGPVKNLGSSTWKPVQAGDHTVWNWAAPKCGRPTTKIHMHLEANLRRKPSCVYTRSPTEQEAHAIKPCDTCEPTQTRGHRIRNSEVAGGRAATQVGEQGSVYTGKRTGEGAGGQACAQRDERVDFLSSTRTHDRRA